MLSAGLLTLNDLKTRILPDGQEARTEWDDDLQDLGKGVAEMFNQYCNRVFPRTVGAVYDVTAEANQRVRGCPAHRDDHQRAGAIRRYFDDDHR